jgi:hypothetical protein
VAAFPSRNRPTSFQRTVTFSPEGKTLVGCELNEKMDHVPRLTAK